MPSSANLQNSKPNSKRMFSYFIASYHCQFEIRQFSTLRGQKWKKPCEKLEVKWRNSVCAYLQRLEQLVRERTGRTLTIQDGPPLSKTDPHYPRRILTIQVESSFENIFLIKIWNFNQIICKVWEFKKVFFLRFCGLIQKCLFQNLKSRSGMSKGESSFSNQWIKKFFTYIYYIERELHYGNKKDADLYDVQTPAME